MPPQQSARDSSEKYMNPEDKENYLQHFHDLVNEGQLPDNSRLLNVHQIFDSKWEYLGAWFCTDSSKNSPLIWVLFNDGWNTIYIAVSDPIKIYTAIAYYYSISAINYRAYGCMGQWFLLSAGDMDLSRYS